MSKEKIKELTKFLKAKAKTLKSDWEDVPQWLIKASIEWMESKEPSEKQKMLAKAGEYLSFDTEEELIHMIKLIANAEEHELIDNVDDDVCVWEKVEWSFNVKEFCQLIGYKKELLD